MATTVRREFEVRDAAKPLAEDLMDNVYAHRMFATAEKEKACMVTHASMPLTAKNE